MSNFLTCMAAIDRTVHNDQQQCSRRPFPFPFVGKLARFIGTLLLALSAMIAPAQAGYEYVDPLPGIVWFPYQNNGGEGTYSSGVDACNFIEKSESLNSDASIATFTGISGPIFRNQTGTLGLFLCNWDMYIPRYVWGPKRYPLDRPLYSGMLCPTPAINPSLPYSFDWYTAKCYRFAQDYLTIALYGLGGDVMPSAKRTAYAQVMSGTTPKSGAQVALTLTVAPENGAPIRAEYVGNISPNGGSTGADGKLNFVFTAPVAGGTHTITATCVGCSNNPVKGTITVPGCKTEDIREVDDIPPNGPDVLPLTQVLERSKGKGLALLPAAQAGLDCVKAKLPGVQISGGTRTVAYQAHLKEVWDKLIELDELEDPAQIRACKPLRDKIKAHKESHSITYPPAKNSDHPKGDAFDISGIEGLLGKLRPPPDLQLPPRPPLTPAQERQADVRLIADWLAGPPTCNLVWGGSYGDRVHFSIP